MSPLTRRSPLSSLLLSALSSVDLPEPGGPSSSVKRPCSVAARLSHVIAFVCFRPQLCAGAAGGKGTITALRRRVVNAYRLEHAAALLEDGEAALATKLQPHHVERRLQTFTAGYATALCNVNHAPRACLAGADQEGLLTHLGIVEEGIRHAWKSSAAHIHLCLDCEVLPPHLPASVNDS